MGDRSMPKYQDIAELAASATEKFLHLESLKDIRAPYPAHGSPNWWSLRKRYEDLLFAEVRRQRSGKGIKNSINEAEAHAAKWAALGNERADMDYQAFVPTAQSVYASRK
jgi:hypothetical protein